MIRICKIGALMLVLCMILALFTGCTQQTSQTEAQNLNIYATFYPLYACAQMITADVPNIQLSCLVQPQDGCLRDYQLSDWDDTLLRRSADLIIAGGCGLERFEDALYSMGETGPAVACVLYGMDLSENPKTAHIDVESESHFLDPNPHIYMHIDGMISIAERISAQLCAVDPKNAEFYQRNLENAIGSLHALSAETHAIAGDLDGKNAILMNEALTYTANEYHLNIVHCVDRDSGEAFFDVELEKCLSELEPYRGSVILIEKQAPTALVNALTDAGFSVAKMDILSTRSAKSGSDGYFQAQRMNAQSLASAYRTGE